MSDYQTPLQIWAKDIRTKYEAVLGHKPDSVPSSYPLSNTIQERMCRIGVEARFFQVGDDHDSLLIIAHHTILQDAIKRA